MKFFMNHAVIWSNGDISYIYYIVSQDGEILRLHNNFPPVITNTENFVHQITVPMSTMAMPVMQPDKKR